MDYQEILDMIKMLDPELAGKYTDEQLLVYIKITEPIAEGDELTGEDAVSGIAFLVLDTLYVQQSGAMNGLKKKKIKDIEIEYAEPTNGPNYFESPWMRLYNMLINGELTQGDLGLGYVGI
jgi:hypothetical protein